MLTAFRNKLFSRVPACRFATFRTLFAFANLIYVIPRCSEILNGYFNSSFHLPVASWIPALPPQAGWLLIGLQYLSGTLLFLGLLPRLSAGFLLLSGLYFFSLDRYFYSHNIQLHFIFLAILTVSPNRLSLFDLVRGKKRGAQAEAWPEHLVRFQLFVIFFYSGLDKIFSPFWGLSGSFFVYEFGHPMWTRFSPLVPGIISVLIILFEFFLAAAFLLKPLWKFAFWAGFFFVVGTELLISPTMFIWDILAALVLFIPSANDAIPYDPESRFDEFWKKILSGFDWLGRFEWKPVHKSETKNNLALPQLIFLIPAPLYLVLSLTHMKLLRISHVHREILFSGLVLAFIFMWVSVREKKLNPDKNNVLILNLNRLNNDRDLRKALWYVSKAEDILIVDLLWNPAMKFAGRNIPRLTLAQSASPESLSQDIDWSLSLMNQMETAGIELWPAFKYQLMANSFAEFLFYILPLNKLLSEKKPDHVVLMRNGNKILESVSSLIRLRNIPIQTV